MATISWKKSKPPKITCLIKKPFRLWLKKFLYNKWKSSYPTGNHQQETYWILPKTNEQQATGLILAGVALIGFVIAGLIDQKHKTRRKKMKQAKKSMVLTKYAITNITCFFINGLGTAAYAEENASNAQIVIHKKENHRSSGSAHSK